MVSPLLAKRSLLSYRRPRRKGLRDAIKKLIEGDEKTDASPELFKDSDALEFSHRMSLWRHPDVFVQSRCYCEL